ncbi:MAG: hypothetical protein ACKO6N_27935 [Myxococcota bacterium]
METASKCPTTRLGNGLETWPNTTFALVYASFDQTLRLGEGVLVGPNSVVTLARNLLSSGQPPSKLEVGVSWDGVSEAEKSAASAWDIPASSDAEADGEEIATILIEKDFSERYGYLGLTPFDDLSDQALFVYAFRKGEKKSEVVQLHHASIHGERLVYDLLPGHDPIVGAAILCRGAADSYTLVGLHLSTDRDHHHALFMTRRRIAKIQERVNHV